MSMVSDKEINQMDKAFDWMYMITGIVCHNRFWGKTEQADSVHLPAATFYHKTMAPLTKQPLWYENTSTTSPSYNFSLKNIPSCGNTERTILYNYMCFNLLYTASFLQVSVSVIYR